MFAQHAHSASKGNLGIPHCPVIFSGGRRKGSFGWNMLFLFTVIKDKTIDSILSSRGWRFLSHSTANYKTGSLLKSRSLNQGKLFRRGRPPWRQLSFSVPVSWLFFLLPGPKHHLNGDGGGTAQGLYSQILSALLCLDHNCLQRAIVFPGK